MHASNTAAWRAKVREASDGIEAVKKELGTGRLHPETIIFAEGQGSALILPTYLPVSWSAKIAPKLCSISWRPFREPSDGLEPSTPPYHRATRRERRARPGSRGHGSPARRRNRPKTSDLPWTPVPALVFPQGSLGYAGAGSPGRAISSVSAMVSLRPASVARMTSSAASEARARSMSSRPTGLSP